MMQWFSSFKPYGGESFKSDAAPVPGPTMPAGDPRHGAIPLSIPQRPSATSHGTLPSSSRSISTRGTQPQEHSSSRRGTPTVVSPASRGLPGDGSQACEYRQQDRTSCLAQDDAILSRSFCVLIPDLRFSPIPGHFGAGSREWPRWDPSSVRHPPDYQLSVEGAAAHRYANDRT